MSYLTQQIHSFSVVQPEAKPNTQSLAVWSRAVMAAAVFNSPLCRFGVAVWINRLHSVCTKPSGMPQNVYKTYFLITITPLRIIASPYSTTGLSPNKREESIRWSIRGGLGYRVGDVCRIRLHILHTLFQVDSLCSMEASNGAREYTMITDVNAQ